MIGVRGLSKRYGATVAVDALSFDLRRGMVTGILGPQRRRQVHHHTPDPWPPVMSPSRQRCASHAPVRGTIQVGVAVVLRNRSLMSLAAPTLLSLSILAQGIFEPFPRRHAPGKPALGQFVADEVCQ
jgi:hypothetical protein